MFLVRRYQPEDKESVKALYLMGLDRFSLTEKSEKYLSDVPDLDDIENAYLNHNGEFLVGIEDDKLVAMGALKRLSEKRAELKRMSVHPRYRKKGYARIILANLLEIADRSGYSELFLDTTAKNIPSQKLCEKFGFVQTQRKKVGDLEVVFYEKKLSL